MSYTSKSKSNRRKPKFVPKPKQQWRVKEHKPNWLDLPSDVMANILHRVGVYHILENAQKVCTSWHSICKEPAMWRVIYMDDTLSYPPDVWSRLPEVCKYAVDRSQGQLVDLAIDFSNHTLLEYVADRSSQLRRLQISNGYDKIDGGFKFLEKFPLLEELSLFRTKISIRDIKTASRCCPMLKTLKVDLYSYSCWSYNSRFFHNEIAIAIGKNLPELKHLELVGSYMTNDGLEVILDGCRHLESLDLSLCSYIDLEGNLGKICSEKIKFLKLQIPPSSWL